MDNSLIIILTKLLLSLASATRIIRTWKKDAPFQEPCAGWWSCKLPLTNKASGENIHNFPVCFSFMETSLTLAWAIG
jgi:hypothetical protein